MRIDKLLWWLRFARTRVAARHLAEAGHIRLNGRRVERPAHAVGIGDRLTMPAPSGAIVIELVALPVRRGPASEAQSCYRVLDCQGRNPIAAGEQEAAKGNSSP